MVTGLFIRNASLFEWEQNVMNWLKDLDHHEWNLGFNDAGMLFAAEPHGHFVAPA